MKTILTIIAFFILLVSNAQELKNYHIVSDTTWASDTVKIYNDIFLSSQATLRINPGVYVEFQGNYSLTVKGSIKAIGTAMDSIIFTIRDTTSFSDTTTLAGGWGSIKLLSNTMDTSFFQYCKFSYGKAIQPGTTVNNHLNENNRGGAIYLLNYKALSCVNCSFYSNRSSWSGGAITIKNAIYTFFSENLFYQNQTYYYGGGIYIQNTPDATIANCRFVKNSAIRFNQTAWGIYVGGAGAGVAVESNTKIYNNVFYNNSSANSALYESAYSGIIYNNIIANNLGGGIMNGHTASHSKYINNTIVNNVVNVQGPGMVIFSNYLLLRNNIVWGNEVIDNWPTPVQVYTPDGNTVNFSYSCNPDGYPGEGNIIENPKFVNPTAGAGLAYDGMAADWSLQDGSPCINAGTPDTTGFNLPAYDLNGNTRLFGNRIDMGAYENQNVWVSLPDNPFVNARLIATPNPFRDVFVVELHGPDKVKRISVYNQTGTPVRQKETLWHEGLVSMDMSGFIAGLYVLVVEYENGTMKTKKMVKL